MWNLFWFDLPVEEKATYSATREGKGRGRPCCHAERIAKVTGRWTYGEGKFGAPGAISVRDRIAAG